MSKEISQFEARAYKRLYGMQKSTLLTIINLARNTVEYSANNPEQVLKVLTAISDEKQWDHIGIESKTDGKIIDELEKCLNEQ